MRQIALSVVVLLAAGREELAWAKQATIAAGMIPFDALTSSNRALVKAVTDHYTLRREYSAQTFKGQLAVFEYLLDHMEACSALAQKLSLITYRATRGADGRLYADDHEGATGFLLNVYTGSPAIAERKRVFYMEGTQHGMFDVHGRGVAVLDYHEKAAGVVQYTGDAFVKVDNVVLAALTQLFSIFLKGAVDSHFSHVIRHPVVLSEKAMAEPEKLLEDIAQMPVADRELLAPFAALVQSNVTNRLK